MKKWSFPGNVWGFFLLTMLSKQMFPFSLSQFENLIKIWLETNLQQWSTSKQTQTFSELTSTLKEFHSCLLSLSFTLIKWVMKEDWGKLTVDFMAILTSGSMKNFECNFWPWSTPPGWEEIWKIMHKDSERYQFSPELQCPMFVLLGR